MKNIPQILILFSALIILSCDNSSKVSYDSDSERIIGTWNWVRTTGGFANIEETPETVGYDKQRVFEKSGNSAIYITRIIHKNKIYRKTVRNSIHFS